MKGRRVAGLCVATLLTAGGTWNSLLACGDKFLVPSRGTRFDRAPLAREPASVLVYAAPQSELSKVIARLPVTSTLQKAGYHVTLASSPEELSQLLTRASWDVVVVELGDGSRTVAESPGATTVLPVAYGASAAEVASARKQFAIVLKTPTRSEAFLDGIDDLMTARVKARQKKGSGTSR